MAIPKRPFLGTRHTFAHTTPARAKKRALFVEGNVLHGPAKAWERSRSRVRAAAQRGTPRAQLSLMKLSSKYSME